MTVMHKIKAAIMKALGTVIIFLFSAMTVIGAYQIITRYFFNRPSTISEELLTYTFVWMSLLASAYVFGKKEHMRMSFLADKITGKKKKILEFSIELLAFSFALIVMVYGGCSITKLTMIQTTASLQIPMGYIYFIIPVAGVIIMVFSIANAIDVLHTDYSKREERTV